MLPEIFSFLNPRCIHFAKPLGGILLINVINDCIGEPIKLIRKVMTEDFSLLGVLTETGVALTALEGGTLHDSCRYI